ncbi:MAG: homoserine dehydrogenase [Peptostreptococcales bacterium]
MEKVNIGLLGLGNVGIGVYNILNLNSNKINVLSNKEIVITKILVNNLNKERDISLAQNMLTSNIDDILEDSDIDIVVEVLGGLTPAYDYIKKALQKKKHVVTANKAVIATYGKELLEIASRNNVSLRYEASVCGGIPVISTLSNALSVNKFEELIGIVNGTTNYILTQMTDFGLDYDDVLEDAKRKGFAEADPSSDVEGEDAAYKLSILLSLTFGVEVPPDAIPRQGITNISKEDIQYAAQFGYKIKLLAAAKQLNNRLEYHVCPTLIKKNHPLSSVNNEFNALFLKGNAVGEIMLYGKGAGSMPTGSAVVSDIFEISRIMGSTLNPTVPIPMNNPENYELVGNGTSEYYIHLIVEDKPGVLGMITTCFGDAGISIDAIVQQSRGDQYVPIVYIVHECPRVRLDQALSAIIKFKEVKEIKSVLQVRK